MARLNNRLILSTSCFLVKKDKAANVLRETRTTKCGKDLSLLSFCKIDQFLSGGLKSFSYITIMKSRIQN